MVCHLLLAQGPVPAAGYHGVPHHRWAGQALLLVKVIREAAAAKVALAAQVPRGFAGVAACIARPVASRTVTTGPGVCGAAQRTAQWVDASGSIAGQLRVLQVVALKDDGVDGLLPHLVEMLLQSRELPDDLLAEGAQLVVAVGLHGGSVALQALELAPVPILHVTDRLLPVALLVRTLLLQQPLLLAERACVVKGVHEPLLHLALLLPLPAQRVLAGPQLLVQRLPADLGELLDVLSGLLGLL
mmetsp:Transcript_21540/g.61003  ORF Transcript_21540/g.61003 Transcript_21540/m.61003 type:complete len:244 (-) Transcript_21540:290-1021(-)